MTREEAKELMPIIQAFTEGKTIEFLQNNGEWDIASSPTWKSGLTYRIKPEPKYRPFKDMKECWHEMMKHQPFGWLKGTKVDAYFLITCVSIYEFYIDSNPGKDFDYANKMYTFADGTPFGVKEEA